MPLDVLATVRIEAAPGAVAAVEFDPARDPEWIGGADRVEWLTTPPLVVGSRVRRIGRFLGRPIEWVMEVQAVEDERHVAMHALKSPFPMDVDYVLEPIAGAEATRARIRIRGSGRMYGLPAWLMAPMVRRSVQADLRRLKEIVERA